MPRQVLYGAVEQVDGLQGRGHLRRHPASRLHVRVVPDGHVMFQYRSSVREPGGPIRLSTRIAAVVPSSSSRRSGAGAATVHDRLSLRRHRGGGDEQAYHRIDGVVQSPVCLPQPACAAITTRLAAFFCL